MSDGVHWLIPFAAGLSPAAQEARKNLSLPALERLLARMAPASKDEGGETDLSMPHERALARAFGMPSADGRIPWAAWHVARDGRDPGTAAHAWITPCHWQVHADHVTMLRPGDLLLDEQESQRLLAAMRPYFVEDGIELDYDSPTRWIARGEMFRGMAAASLDRVGGRVIDPWMPRGEEARPLRRLQQEMQMLLYTDPLNEERAGRGLPAVNSFWVSGAGALEVNAPGAKREDVHVADALRNPALDSDWTAWTAAWRELDARDIPRLQALADSGKALTVTLCGERSSQSWTTQAGGWWQRIASTFRLEGAADFLEPL
jgi:hypothetical protein